MSKINKAINKLTKKYFRDFHKVLKKKGSPERDQEVNDLFSEYLVKVEKKLEAKYFYAVEPKYVEPVFRCNGCFITTKKLFRCVPLDIHADTEERHSYCVKCWLETRNLPNKRRDCIGAPVPHSSPHVIGVGRHHFENLSYEDYKRTYKGLVCCEDCKYHIPVATYVNHRPLCLKFKQFLAGEGTAETAHDAQNAIRIAAENAQLREQLALERREKRALEEERKLLKERLEGYEEVDYVEMPSNCPKVTRSNLKAEVKDLLTGSVSGNLKEIRRLEAQVKALKDDKRRLALENKDLTIKLKTHPKEIITPEAMKEFRDAFALLEGPLRDVDALKRHAEALKQAWHRRNEEKDWDCRRQIQQILFRQRMSRPKSDRPAREFVVDPWGPQRAERTEDADLFMANVSVYDPKFENGRKDYKFRLDTPMDKVYHKIKTDLNRKKNMHLVGLGMFSVSAEDLPGMQLQDIAFGAIDENNNTTSITLQSLSDDAFTAMLEPEGLSRGLHPMLVAQTGFYEGPEPLSSLCLETVIRQQTSETQEEELFEEERRIREYYEQYNDLAARYVSVSEATLKSLRQFYADIVERHPTLLKEGLSLEFAKSCTEFFPWMKEVLERQADGSKDTDPPLIEVAENAEGADADDGDDAAPAERRPSSDDHMECEPTEPTPASSSKPPQELEEDEPAEDVYTDQGSQITSPRDALERHDLNERGPSRFHPIVSLPSLPEAELHSYPSSRSSPAPSQKSSTSVGVVKATIGNIERVVIPHEDGVEYSISTHIRGQRMSTAKPPRMPLRRQEWEGPEDPPPPPRPNQRPPVEQPTPQPPGSSRFLRFASIYEMFDNGVAPTPPRLPPRRQSDPVRPSATVITRGDDRSQPSSMDTPPNSSPPQPSPAKRPKPPSKPSKPSKP